MGVATERYSKQHAEGRFARDVPAPRKGIFVRSQEPKRLYLIESTSAVQVLVRPIGQGKDSSSFKIRRGDWEFWCRKLKVCRVNWGP